MTAEEWADEGMADLVEDLLTHDFPLSDEKAGAFIRAAYGRGYVNALEASEPPIVLDALRLNQELVLRVPVL